MSLFCVSRIWDERLHPNWSLYSYQTNAWQIELCDGIVPIIVHISNYCGTGDVIDDFTQDDELVASRSMIVTVTLF